MKKRRPLSVVGPFRVLVLLASFATLCAANSGREIGFIERFALAEDREQILKELIPGTAD